MELMISHSVFLMPEEFFIFHVSETEKSVAKFEASKSFICEP